MRISIKSPSIGTVFAELTDENPVTAKAFYEALPVMANAQLWGEEIFFSISLKNIAKENSREVVRKGEVGIWVANPSFCIFFGRTPVSTEKEIRAYSPVNVIGKVKGVDPVIFKKVRSGEKITIDKVADVADR